MYKFYPVLMALILSGCVTVIGSDQISQSSDTKQPAEQMTQTPNKKGLQHCQLTAFLDTFVGEHKQLSVAKSSAQQQCLTKYHAMFCQESAIKCNT